MRGYTGSYYNGVPVFIREDYERAHAGESDLERLNDTLGDTYSSLELATSTAYNINRSLLYHTRDPQYDIYLRGGRDPKDVWQPYRGGFVHEVTGEFVDTCVPPKYDSYPAWYSRNWNRSINHTEGVGIAGLAILSAMLKELLKE